MHNCFTLGVTVGRTNPRVQEGALWLTSYQQCVPVPNTIAALTNTVHKRTIKYGLGTMRTRT
eukprot:8376224-Pyramimonas_sp.AAC.1